MIIEGAEPRWDRDLAYGKQGELYIDTLLSWVARGNGRVEVKSKRYLDFELYVETACDKGRTGIYTPSGIQTTEADVWAYNVGDTGIALMVPTKLLRAGSNDKSAKPKEETDGTCPTRGKLVNLGLLLRIARDSYRP